MRGPTTVATTRPTCRGRTRSCRRRAELRPRSPRACPWAARRRTSRHEQRCAADPGSSWCQSSRFARQQVVVDPVSCVHSSAVRRGAARSRSGARCTSSTRIARSSLSVARMSRAVHVPQTFLADLGVDLRRRDRGVAEHLLHHAQIGAVVEQMGRTAVAQHVWRQLVRDAARSPYFFMICHAACRVSRTPRVLRNTASTSPRSATAGTSHRTAARREPRPSSAAAAAIRTEPIRSLAPLPYSRTSAASSRSRRSTARRPQESGRRWRTGARAEPGPDDGSARSRHRVEQALTSASVSGWGMPDGTRTPSSSPPGRRRARLDRQIPMQHP